MGTKSMRAFMRKPLLIGAGAALVFLGVLLLVLLHNPKYPEVIPDADEDADLAEPLTYGPRFGPQSEESIRKCLKTGFDVVTQLTNNRAGFDDKMRVFQGVLDFASNQSLRGKSTIYIVNNIRDILATMHRSDCSYHDYPLLKPFFIVYEEFSDPSKMFDDEGHLTAAGKNTLATSWTAAEKFAGDRADLEAIIKWYVGIAPFAVRSSQSGKSATFIDNGIRETLACLDLSKCTPNEWPILNTVFSYLFVNSSKMLDGAGHLTPAGKDALTVSWGAAKKLAGENARIETTGKYYSGIGLFALRLSLSGKSATFIDNAIRETLACLDLSKCTPDEHQTLSKVFGPLYSNSAKMFDGEGHLSPAGKNALTVSWTAAKKLAGENAGIKSTAEWYAGIGSFALRHALNGKSATFIDNNIKETFACLELSKCTSGDGEELNVVFNQLYYSSSKLSDNEGHLTPAGKSALKASWAAAQKRTLKNAPVRYIAWKYRGIGPFVLRLSLSGKPITYIDNSTQDILALIDSDQSMNSFSKAREAVWTYLYANASTMFNENGNLTDAGKRAIESRVPDLFKGK